MMQLEITESCTNCKRCISVCAEKAIIDQDNSEHPIILTNMCDVCFECIYICDNSKAISLLY